MNTTAQPSNLIFNENLIVKFFISRMNKGLKRLVVMSSLIAFILGTNDPEKGFLRNLDKILSFTRSNESALGLPVSLSKVFWRHRRIVDNEIDTLRDPNSTESEKQEAAMSLVSKVPSWVTYADPTEMSGEIVRYFVTPKLG